jgi:heme exporter protein D
LSEFLAMGGYGLYVWGSFGVTAIVMLGEMVSLRARRRALRDEPAADRVSADYREGTA